MARLLYKEDSVALHKRLTRRHIRLCGQDKGGFEQYIMSPFQGFAIDVVVIFFYNNIIPSGFCSDIQSYCRLEKPEGLSLL
jgi:hypothetical protein